ncbi:MAG: 1-phosphofructokinase family hexose kinase [Firmicutes bacterium]|jgi:1-phosphofructokinase family hexose kinase|nr:1-phosphofructokinase family hexose kinase [Bacillota bacterium]
MILTVTPSPAVDKTYVVPDFQVGVEARVDGRFIVPAGKAVNVARVARALGEEVSATGFLAGDRGEFVQRHLETLGIITDFAWIGGDTRETVTVLDPVSGMQTRLMEIGPVVTEDDVRSLEAKVRAMAAGADVITLGGRLPEGAPPDLYRRILDIVRQMGAPVILDAHGLSLRLALGASPFLIKPNQAELAELVERPIGGPEDAVQAALEIQEDGVECVVVSLGSQGAVAVCADGAFRVYPLVVKVVNTVGCGDSLVAGLAVELARAVREARMTGGVQLSGLPDGWLVRGLVLGTAAAASNAVTETAGTIDPEGIPGLAACVQVERMSPGQPAT